jgi:hypothetical protein
MAARLGKEIWLSTPLYGDPTDGHTVIGSRLT